MKYTSVSAALEALRAVESKLSAYHHAMGVLFLDAATAAPKGSAQGRGQTMAMLSETVYALNANPENEALLSYLEAHLQELDPVDRRKVELFRKSYNQISKIPPQEYIEYDVLLNDAQAVWEQAKKTDDFALFAPYLEKIVGFNQKFAGYYNPSLPPYDALLNEYEEGLTVETLDRFFAQLREVLVPLLAKVTAAEPIDDSFLHQLYPMEQQHQLSDYIMSVLGIDRNYCAIAESEHPFTSGFHNKDVRITTHYYEQEPVFSLYSVIHEGGHAIYEMGCEDRYNHTFLAGGASMGIHESQSRFIELFGAITETVPLSYYIEALNAGKSLAGEEECPNKVLKTGATTYDYFDATQVKNLPDDYEPLEDHRIKTGDVIISRMNTAELVGAAAYVWEAPERTYLPDRLWKAEIKETACPIFIWQVLIQSSTKERIRQIASGTSGSMKNISKPGLLGIRVKKVDLAAQEQFAAFVAQTDKSKLAVQQGLKELEILKKSLMQQYFG